MERKHYWYWLSCRNYLDRRQVEKLLKVFHDPVNLFSANREELKMFGLNEMQISDICNSREEKSVIDNYNKLQKKGIYFVTIEEQAYPNRLRNIYEAPYFLFYMGRLPEEEAPMIAVIGARNCSSYGKEMAIYFGKRLTNAGVSVVSGLARGIDSYAQKAVLQEGGATFGILGNGIDHCFPVENTGIYMEVQRNGGVISEYAPGCPGLPKHFPMRNRLISGFSDGILVVEARKRSGTLITVERGLEQGKDIYALPGRIDDPLSEGCNKLIQNGAKLIYDIDDILEELSVLYSGYLLTKQKLLQKPFAKETMAKDTFKNLLASDEKMVYAILSLHPKHLELIASETGLGLSSLLSVLTSLELRGMIRQAGRNYYIQCKE